MRADLRAVWLTCGLLAVSTAAGCGVKDPAPPVVDAAAEKDDERRINAAAAAERKAAGRQTGKSAKPTRNPDDDN
jgi:hypothetical protein